MDARNPPAIALAIQTALVASAKAAVAFAKAPGRVGAEPAPASSSAPIWRLRRMRFRRHLESLFVRKRASGGVNEAGWSWRSSQLYLSWHAACQPVEEPCGARKNPRLLAVFLSANFDSEAFSTGCYAMPA